MKEKYRGEIPYFLSSLKNNIIYLCSSNRNLEDYFYILKDLVKNQKIYKFEIKEDISEIRKINYDILNIIKNNEKYIILITINVIFADYFKDAKKLDLKLNEEINLLELEEKLVELNFNKVYMVKNKKEFSRRGDIFDIFTENLDNPIRIELFGDFIERINLFDIESQKSIKKLEDVEMYIDNNKNIFSFLDIMYMANNKFDLYIENKELIDYKIEKYKIDNQEKLEEIKSKEVQLFNLYHEIKIINFNENQIKKLENVDEIKKLTEKYNITIYSREAQRYEKIFANHQINIIDYPLYEGYIDNNNLVITDRELKGIRVTRNIEKTNENKYQNVSEIKYNEYIIHENFGVGIFKGIENIDGKDYLQIKYADEDKLFVPIDGITKIEKYINTSGEVPEIYKLGKKGFSRKKEKIKEDIELFAREILKIQAKREMGNGFSFSTDTVWQEEFENAFPFQETESQLKAIEDVKKDMESTKIMDRLICGDVGFGKTEVAIRASFKAITNHKQVVLLVPTTILAQQHYERFKERFKNYPFNIELLSRVKTQKEQNIVIENIKNGSSDILIGTHRILSDDISFKDLGLVIIDEEQKFGVKAKEKLKKIKDNVDLLTLTATPIPRTLNLSLLGIKDLSIIDTPPFGRKKIETIFIDDREEDIKKIVLNEIAREGQVFYIYNRVKYIEEKTRYLKEILPKYLKIDFIHGQMLAKDIKRRISDFEAGLIDILVSTTIIENGIDIENANTMIIDGAEKLGLSQIYQLRGRIGRSSKKSYCYILKREFISKKAKLREESLIEFSDGGMQLSLEDMKIRGVGEILGEKQHGAVETFGYNLYIKMLNEEIDKLKSRYTIPKEDVNVVLNFEKFIPESYINKEEKLNIYKRALNINNIDEILELDQELKDRFGKMPKAAKGFIRYIYIKQICQELNIKELVEISDNKYRIFFEDDTVDFDKILKLIIEKKISYNEKDKNIHFRGNIFNFFELYKNKMYKKY